MSGSIRQLKFLKACSNMSFWRANMMLEESHLGLTCADFIFKKGYVYYFVSTVAAHPQHCLQRWTWTQRFRSLFLLDEGAFRMPWFGHSQGSDWYCQEPPLSAAFCPICSLGEEEKQAKTTSFSHNLVISRIMPSYLVCVRVGACAYLGSTLARKMERREIPLSLP